MQWKFLSWQCSKKINKLKANCGKFIAPVEKRPKTQLDFAVVRLFQSPKTIASHVYDWLSKCLTGFLAKFSCETWAAYCAKVMAIEPPTSNWTTHLAKDSSHKFIKRCALTLTLQLRHLQTAFWVHSILHKEKIQISISKERKYL